MFRASWATQSSGGQTVAASDTQSFEVGLTGSSTAVDLHEVQGSATYYVTLNANQSDTFTLNYRSSGGDTITYVNRSITVIPMP